MSETRTLTRFEPRKGYPNASGEGLRHGLFLDVETTGLDPMLDKIIEFAMVPFVFDQHGRVLVVHEGRSWLEDPGMAIPADVVELTGITDAMVAGQRIDDAAVEDAIMAAHLVIAHNAEFDRKFSELRWNNFVRKAWACSYRDVDWKLLWRAPCGKLSHLLMETCREYYDAHRALDDAQVGVHLLASAEHEGVTALGWLLDSARAWTHRVWAVGSPYGMKGELKRRGYRWHDGETGPPKNWYRDGSADDAMVETRWLGERLVRSKLDKFNAFDRYSVRV